MMEDGGGVGWVWVWGRKGRWMMDVRVWKWKGGDNGWGRGSVGGEMVVKFKKISGGVGVVESVESGVRQGGRGGGEGGLVEVRGAVCVPNTVKMNDEMQGGGWGADTMVHGGDGRGGRQRGPNVVELELWLEQKGVRACELQFQTAGTCGGRARARRVGAGSYSGRVTLGSVTERRN